MKKATTQKVIDEKAANIKAADKSTVTGRRVVRVLRRHQHRVAVLRYIATDVLSRLSDAYEDVPPCLVSVGGVLELADFDVVNALFAELSERADEAQRQLEGLMEGDITTAALHDGVEDEDEEQDEQERDRMRCKVVRNPQVSKEAV